MQVFIENDNVNSSVNEGNGSSTSDIPVQLTSDGTNITLISHDQNTTAFSELIAKATEIYNLAKLDQLRKEKGDAYLEEVERQVNGLVKVSNSITAHSDVFGVQNLIKIGTILNDAKATFKRTVYYKDWEREKFGSHQERRLQQARQLALMGQVAIDFAGAGKNRLLDFDRIRNEVGVVELMKRRTPPDIAQDDDGNLFKVYVDAVLIYKRMQDEKIDITFEQAQATATICKKALEIKKVKKLAEEILEQPTDELKGKFLDEWINGGCVFEREKNPEKTKSINIIIAHLTGNPEKYDLNDAATLKDVNTEDIRKAYLSIWTLAQKVKINLSPPKDQADEN